MVEVNTIHTVYGIFWDGTEEVYTPLVECDSDMFAQCAMRQWEAGNKHPYANGCFDRFEIVRVMDFSEEVDGE